MRSLLAKYRRRRDSWARRMLGLRLGEWERFESEELASKCFKSAWNSPGMAWRRFILCAFLIACCLSVQHLLHDSYSTVEQMIAVNVCIVLAIFLADGIVILPSAFLFRRLPKRHLRQAMNENGMPTCIECGYNLTGVPSARCPECGASKKCK